MLLIRHTGTGHEMRIDDDALPFFQEYEVVAEGDSVTVAKADIPPRGGAGSGREAWADYASGKVPVTDDMTRDDIIAALEEASVPTE